MKFIQVTNYESTDNMANFFVNVDNITHIYDTSSDIVIYVGHDREGVRVAKPDIRPEFLNLVYGTEEKLRKVLNG